MMLAIVIYDLLVFLFLTHLGEAVPSFLSPRSEADYSPLLYGFDTPSKAPSPYGGDETGFTAYGPEIPKWPPAPVDEIVIQAKHSEAFPHMNLNIRHYHNASCETSKIPWYQFLNGTVANATYKDLMNDLEEIYKPGNQDKYDLYMSDTLAIFKDVYRLANDTLSWINWTDIPGNPDSVLNPGESLLPVPEAWQKAIPVNPPPLVPKNNGKTRLRRRARSDEQQPDVENQLIHRPPDDPPPEPQHDIAYETHTAPGLSPAPENRPEQVQESDAVLRERTRADKVWDAVIIVVGSAIGCSLSYGFLEAGSHVYPVNRKIELSNMFAAFGLAVGIITGVIIGVIQKRRFDAFHSGQVAALRESITGLRTELRDVRKDITNAARDATRTTVNVLTPNRPLSEIVPAVANDLVAKPIKKVASTTKVAVGNIGDGLNVAVEKTSETVIEGMKRTKGSFNSLKDNIKTKSSSLLSSMSGDSGDLEPDEPSTSSAPPRFSDLTESSLDDSGTLYVEQMRDAITSPSCPVPGGPEIPRISEDFQAELEEQKKELEEQEAQQQLDRSQQESGSIPEGQVPSSSNAPGLGHPAGTIDTE